MIMKSPTAGEGWGVNSKKIEPLPLPNPEILIQFFLERYPVDFSGILTKIRPSAFGVSAVPPILLLSSSGSRPLHPGHPPGHHASSPSTMSLPCSLQAVTNWGKDCLIPMSVPINAPFPTTHPEAALSTAWGLAGGSRAAPCTAIGRSSSARGWG